MLCVYVYLIGALHAVRCGKEGYCLLCCFERKACWKFEGYDGCPEQQYVLMSFRCTMFAGFLLV